MNDASKLLSRWQARLDRMQIAYYEAGRRYERRHLWIGIPAIAISTLVGAAVFKSATSGTDRSIDLQIAAGTLSLAAAILTALQTFLGYKETADKFNISAAKFANLRHRVEMLVAMPVESQSELREKIEGIEKDWNAVRLESRALPLGIWKKVEQTFEPESLDD